MELEMYLTALAWGGMKIGEFEKLPREERIKMLATVRARHYMEYVSATGV